MEHEKYWNREIETTPMKELRERQLKKLKHLVKYCYDNIRFYKKRFDEAGLKPRDIGTLEDLQKIPFTIKNDLRDNYPYGMVAASLEDIGCDSPNPTV